MNIHLLTRVNLKFDERREFTEKRRRILHSIVAPAVRQQTYMNFKRIALVDISTSQEDIELFKTIFDAVYIGEGYNSYKQYVSRYKGEEILSIRLDSDDIPAPEYVEEIVKAVDKTKKTYMIVANRGTDESTVTGQRINIQVDYPIGFFGLYEKKFKVGCYEKSHIQMDYPIVYLSDYTDKLLRTRLIHEANRGSKSLLNKYKIDGDNTK